MARVNAARDLYDYMQVAGPLQSVDFHELFGRDIPDKEDRDELLVDFARPGAAFPGVRVDAATGMIIRTNWDRKQLALNYSVLGGVWLVGLAAAAHVFVDFARQASWYPERPARPGSARGSCSDTRLLFGADIDHRDFPGIDRPRPDQIGITGDSLLHGSGARRHHPHRPLRRRLVRGLRLRPGPRGTMDRPVARAGALAARRCSWCMNGDVGTAIHAEARANDTGLMRSMVAATRMTRARHDRCRECIGYVAAVRVESGWHGLRTGTRD